MKKHTTKDITYIRQNFNPVKCPFNEKTAFFASKRYAHFFEFYICDYTEEDKVVFTILCPNCGAPIGVGIRLLFNPFDKAS